MFASQNEAKTFFVDKIVAQAEVEGEPLSSDEQWMLRFSESDPDFVVDAARVEQLEAEISEKDYETKIAGLLQRSRQRDVEAAGIGARAAYCEASEVLQQGDHYLLVIVDRAIGLQPERPERTPGTPLSRVLVSSGLFLLLVLPGSFAMLIAAGLVVMTVTTPGQSPAERVAMLLFSCVPGALGYYLIRLWRRERRSRRAA